MIAEKLSLKFDVKRIQEYFNANVKHLPPIWQNNMFGGWSILSASGDYQDGFQKGHMYFVTDPETGKTSFDYERAHREVGFNWPREHINPTQVGGGYINEMIEMIREAKLRPHRARWTVITPGGHTSWHRDMADHLYGVRLHIPVITNPDTAFETAEGAFHMSGDGSCYLVAVNRVHQAYNKGQEDRIHIIMDVIDDTGVSQHHTYDQHLEKFPK
jgi:hypothetical protein